MVLVIALFLLSSLPLQASPSPAAWVNGHAIPQADVDEYALRHEGVDRSEALDRLILFRLAVDEAKRRGVGPRRRHGKATSGRGGRDRLQL